MAADIQSRSWMDPATKKKALLKLRPIKSKIGDPDRWRDYRALHIARDDFATNVARAEEFETKRDLAKIGRRVDRAKWFMTPPTVNACYDPQTNQMNFLAGVLQPRKLTLGEDVADLGGTMLAYLAWKHATASQAFEPIDGFTPEQRFFVGLAQWGCGDSRFEQKRLDAIVNPHSPGAFRVDGVVSNMPQFGKAFGCKEGQPMMRADACRGW